MDRSKPPFGLLKLRNVTSAFKRLSLSGFLFLRTIFTSERILTLFPPKARVVSRHILDRIGFTLTKWIVVKIFSMLEVTVFTLIGLSVVGVPMAFALSVIAGLLNFVPNFGPLVAMVPAVLVGLMTGFDTALIIAALYILIQIIDGSIIVPALQQKLIRIPPAILIMSQLFMGILSGGWGVLLATPLLVIIMIVIEETYLKKQGGAT